MLFSSIFDIYSVFGEYNSVALSAAMATIVIYIVVMAVIFGMNKKRGKATLRKKTIAERFIFFVIFSVYFSYLICLTLSGREAGSRGEIMNIVPFSTIFDLDNFSVTIVENILLFIPFGAFLPCLAYYYRNSVRTVVTGLIASAVIETLQLTTKRGYFDVDDIILNTFGALLGYMLFAGLFDGVLGINRRIVTEMSALYGDCNVNIEGSERFALKNPKVLFAVQSVPVVTWYMIIMGFSSNNGYQSGYLSKSLLYNILVLFGGAETMSRITEDIDEQIVLMDRWEAILRKLAHMTEYAVFAVLVWALLYSIIRLNKTYAYSIALIAVSAVGAADEINQLSVIGRSGTYVDVIVDLAGASIALVIVTYAMVRIRKKYKDKYWTNLPS